MTTITADQLRDLANIQHARSLGETPLHQTPAWLAAERIEALEEQLAELETQTAQLSARLIESDVERDKLAAHTKRLDSAGHALYYELEQWSLTEGDPETKAAMKLWRLARGEEPVISLARLITENQTQAMEQLTQEFRNAWPDAESKYHWLTGAAIRIGRQAEGGAQ